MSDLFDIFKEAPYNCPKCQSNEVEYEDLGELLMTPLAGSQKVKLKCKKCNYKWEEEMK